MNHIRRILAAVAMLAGALLSLAAAPAAGAVPLPLPPHGGSGSGVGGAHGTVRVIATGGMPGWQIALIAAAAALAAAVLAVLADRAWVARRRTPPRPEPGSARPGRQLNRLGPATGRAARPVSAGWSRGDRSSRPDSPSGGRLEHRATRLDDGGTGAHVAA